MGGYLVQGIAVISLGACLLGYAGGQRLYRWLKRDKKESERRS